MHYFHTAIPPKAYPMYKITMNEDMDLGSDTLTAAIVDDAHTIEIRIL